MGLALVLSVPAHAQAPAGKKPNILVVSRLISLDFGYRIWDFDYESDNDLKTLDAALAGFAAGLTFHF